MSESLNTGSKIPRRAFMLLKKDRRSPEINDALAALFFADRRVLLNLIQAGVESTGYVVNPIIAEMFRASLATVGSDANIAPTPPRTQERTAVAATVPSPVPVLPSVVAIAPAPAPTPALDVDDEFARNGILFESPSGLGLFRKDASGGFFSIESLARSSPAPKPIIVRAVQHLDALRRAKAPAAVEPVLPRLDQATLDALAGMGLDTGAASPGSSPSIDLVRRGIFGD